MQVKPLMALDNYQGVMISFFVTQKNIFKRFALDGDVQARCVLTRVNRFVLYVLIGN